MLREKTTEEALREMHDLLTGALGLRMGLTVVLGTALKQFGVDAACVLLFERYSDVPHYAADAGLQTVVLRRPGGGDASGRSDALAVLADDTVVLTHLPDDHREDFKARYAWPLIYGGRLLGALQVFRCSAAKPDDAWRSSMEELATHLAASIGAARRAGRPFGPTMPSRN